MELSVVMKAFIFLALFLAIANIIKHTLLRGQIIPSSLIAGVLALSFSPQLLGQYIDLTIQGQSMWLDENVIKVWRELPGYLIVVVFAGIFLGKSIPSLSQTINQSMPNLGFGYTIAIGQYVVGMLTALLLISPLFDTDAIAGALIAIGFQGGHGTVAGLESTFSELSFSQGVDLGLGIATIGLLSAILLGTLISNVRSEQHHEPEISDNDDKKEVTDRPFGLQFAVLGSVIALAWLLLTGLQTAEQALFSNSEVKVIKYMPLFPVAMITGLIIQMLMNKAQIGHWVSHYQINLISNLALDLLIVSALGALNLEVLAQNWQIIVLLGAVGVAYSAGVYFLAGSWFFNKDWKVRGIGELGQSMGTTAVGLLMLKQATSKPEKHVRPFSYKQPLYEPIVGGGIVTALALPMIANLGATTFAVVMTCLLATVLAGFYMYRRAQQD